MFVALQFVATSVFLNYVPQYAPWKMGKMLSGIFLTVVLSCAQLADYFFLISIFLGTYKFLQIYEANGGKITLKDALKMYAKKYLRLAPMLYLVFLFGWTSGARLSEGPAWINYENLFYKCDSYWWAQLLFVGNLVPWF